MLVSAAPVSRRGGALVELERLASRPRRSATAPRFISTPPDPGLCFSAWSTASRPRRAFPASISSFARLFRGIQPVGFFAIVSRQSVSQVFVNDGLPERRAWRGRRSTIAAKIFSASPSHIASSPRRSARSARCSRGTENGRRRTSSASAAGRRTPAPAQRPAEEQDRHERPAAPAVSASPTKTRPARSPASGKIHCHARAGSTSQRG